MLRLIHESTLIGRSAIGRWPPPGGPYYCDAGSRSVFVHHWIPVTTYLFSETFSDSHANGKPELRDPWVGLGNLVSRAGYVVPRVAARSVLAHRRELGS